MNIRMKSPLLVAALVAAGVAVAGTAMARGDCAHEPRADRAGKMGMMKERHAVHMSERFDELAASLALREEQQPAWQAFREGWSQRPDIGPRELRGAELSAPERMQRMEQSAEARLEQVRRMRELTEGLCAVLDDAQRKVFDAQRPHGREAMHGHPKHPRHG